MNKIKSLFAIIVLLITINGVTSAYAAHRSGSSGGGGCGNCIPPTIGVNSFGTERVEGGISINSIPFDVELYSQNIPTQTLTKGETSTITLKIYEDTGADAVIHAELHFNPYDKVINGVSVEYSTVHFVWHNEYGDEIIGIYDDDEIFQNIIINTETTDEFKIINFEFEPTIIMDETTLMTRIWDDKKNVVNNYFENAIKIIDSNKSESIQTSESQMTIPTWIKSNTGWWAEDKISDDTFLEGIEYMIKEDIISIPIDNNVKSNNNENMSMPNWIKKTSKWWSDDLISDDEFVKSLQFLINNNIISVQR